MKVELVQERIVNQLVGLKNRFETEFFLGLQDDYLIF